MSDPFQYNQHNTPVTSLHDISNPSSIATTLKFKGGQLATPSTTTIDPCPIATASDACDTSNLPISSQREIALFENKGLTIGEQCNAIQNLILRSIQNFVIW